MDNMTELNMTQDQQALSNTGNTPIKSSKLALMSTSLDC